MSDFTQTGVETFEGQVPAGSDLVVMQRGDEDSAMVLYGFDEIGEFEEKITDPVYGFFKWTDHYDKMN